MINLNEQPPGLRLPAEFGLDPESEQSFRDAAWELIVKGVGDPVELAEYAAEDLEGLSDADAERAASYLVAARRTQQAGFGELPPNKLDLAFADLERQKIIARQDWTCCGTCGIAEIGNDVEDVSAWRGYVFFHTQDTNQLIENHSTYLNYGIFWANHVTEAEFHAMSQDERQAFYERACVALMSEVVVPTFERHGIVVDWDNDFGQRMLLGGVDWYCPI